MAQTLKLALHAIIILYNTAKYLFFDFQNICIDPKQFGYNDLKFWNFR